MADEATLECRGKTLVQADAQERVELSRSDGGKTWTSGNWLAGREYDPAIEIWIIFGRLINLANLIVSQEPDYLV